ncbi:tail fiber domain-containing protein, partial [Candidatus Kaiserbacteria bacterium]|nr:tail fiber domain-containing protein [Candidatus Kaiserbacteria bacterium]
SILVTDGSGVPSLSTTLPAHTLGGAVTGNSQNLTGLNQLTVTGTTATSTFSTGGLTVGTNQFLIQQTSGNVGIGTTTPAQLFSVHGNALISGNLNIAGITATSTITSSATSTATYFAASTLGTTGAPAFTFSSDLNTGFFSSGADTLNLSTAGTERLRIDASGNLGIGTTTPGTLLSVSGSSGLGVTNTGSGNSFYVEDVANDTTPFVIDGVGNVGIGTTNPSNLLTLNSTANYGIALQNSGVNESYIGQNVSSAFWAVGSSVNDLVVRSEGNNIHFTTDSGITAQMTLRNGGNVGIGTTSPNSSGLSSGYRILEVANNSSGGTGTLILTGSQTSADGAVGLIDMYNAAGTARIAAIQGSRGSANNSGQIQFYTNNAGGGLSERVRIQSDGNIGIGTTSPMTLLALQGAGTSFLTMNSTDNRAFINYRTGQADGDAVSLGNMEFVFDANTGATGLNGRRLAAISASTHGATATNRGGLLAFHTKADGGTGTIVERMRIDNAGNVGIGTTTPTKALDVNGSFRSRSSLTVDRSTGDGVAYFGVIQRDAASSGNFSNALGNGQSEVFSFGTAGLMMGTIGAQPLALGTNNAERLRIDSGGNIGIGTTSPAQLLSVSGTGYFSTALGIGISSPASGQDLHVNNISSSADLAITSANGANINIGEDSALGAGSYGYIQWDQTNDLIQLGTQTGGDAVTINEGGNVGIGTTSPLSKLHVQDANQSVNDFPNLFVSTSNAAAIDIGGSIALGGHYGTGFNPTTFAWIAGRKENATNANYDGYLSFFTNVSGVGMGTEKMRITSTGNVGIGTTGPLAPLVVVKTGGGIQNTIFSENAQSAAADVGSRLSFTGGSSSIGLGDIAAAWDGAATTDSYLAFRTRSSNSLGERVRITSGGNIGIGTTGPESPFHVAGSSSGGAITAIIDNAAGSTLNNEARLRFLTDGGASATVGGAIIAAINTSAGDGANALYFSTYTGAALTEKVRITSAGNVGIGTTSPATGAKLHVVQPSYNYQDMVVESGIPSMRFADNESNQTTYGMLIDGSNMYFDSYTYANRFSNGYGSHIMTFSGGNVGIGTTSPSDMLSVGGASAGVYGIDIRGDNNVCTSYPCIRSGGGGSMNLASAAGSNIVLQSDRSGNVGIGTTVPGATLDVKAPGTSTGSYETISYFHKTTTQDPIGVIQAKDGAIRLLASYLGTAANVNLVLSGTASAGTQGEYLTVQGSDGNVGIGTTVPGAKLDVRGAVNLIASGTGWTNGLNLYSNDGTNAWNLLTDDGQSDGLQLGFNSTPKVFFKTDGNVGIGTTNPANAKVVIQNDSSGALAQALSLENRGTSANDTGVNLRFIALRSNGTNQEFGYIKTVVADNTVGVEDGRMTLGTIFNSSSVDALNIYSGNVGIGTTTPTSILNIANTGAAQFTITDTNASTNQKHWYAQSSDGAFNIGTTSDAFSAQSARMTIDVNGNMVAANAGGVSYKEGDYLVHSDEVEYSILDTNADSNYKLMKAWRVDKSGSARVRFAAYIQSGTYYWAFKIAKNGGTTLTKVGGGNATGHYASSLYTGETSSVHAYRRFEMDVTGLVPGDLLELWMVSSDSSGNPTVGASQTLFAKEFRVSSNAPAYGKVAEAAVADNQVVINESSDSGSGPALTLQRSRGSSLTSPTAILSGNNLGTVNFQGLHAAFANNTAASYGPYTTSAQILALATENFSSTAKGSALTFSTTDNTTTTLDERMRIDQNGNVGIGTTGPGANLDIVGASGMGSFNLGSTASSGYQAQISFMDTDNSVAGDGVGGRRVGIIELAKVAGSAGQDGANMLLYTHQANGSLKNPLTLMGTGDVIMNAGNIGIGTTDTTTGGFSNKMVVKQSANANWRGIAVEGTDDTVLSMDYLGSNVFGLFTSYRSGGGYSHISFGPGGTEKMRITTDGNVGIGETVPVNRLHIQGSGTSGQVTAAMLLENSSSGTLGFDITGAAGSSYARFQYGGGPGTGTNSMTGTAMIIGLEGSIAGDIGIGTTGPGARLDVDSTDSSQVIVRRTSGSGVSTDHAIAFINGSATDYVGKIGHLGSLTGGWTFDMWTDENYPLTFWNNSTEKMRIDQTGHVGIGTTSPSSVLPNGFTGANGKILALESAGSNGSTGIFLRRGASPTDVGLDMWSDSANGPVYLDSRYVITTSNGGFRFRTQTAGTPVEAVAINGAGNVGIGTNAPAYPLDVNVNGSYARFYTSSGASTVMITSSTGNAATLAFNVNSSVINVQKLSTGPLMINDSSFNTLINRDGGSVGMGDPTPDFKLDVWGTICQDTDSNDTCDGAVTSDARLKTNVENIDDPLAKLALLRGVSFDWDETNPVTEHLGRGTRQIGVIAQEVEAVFPSLVYTDMQGYKMVDYQKLVGPLIEGVNVLNMKIDDIATTTDIDTLLAASGYEGFADSSSLVTDAITAVSILIDGSIKKIQGGVYAAVGMFDTLISDMLIVTQADIERARIEHLETEELCVGDVCVLEDDFLRVFGDGTGTSTAQTGAESSDTSSPSASTGSTASSTPSDANDTGTTTPVPETTPLDAGDTASDTGGSGTTESGTTTASEATSEPASDTAADAGSATAAEESAGADSSAAEPSSEPPSESAASSEPSGDAGTDSAPTGG